MNGLEPTTRYSPAIVYCDATHRYHEDKMASVGYVVTNHNGRIVDRDGRSLGKGYTCNGAEAVALDEALDHVSSIGIVNHLIVRTDSRVALDKHRAELQSQYESRFQYLRFEHVPREQNVSADIEADRQHDRAELTAPNRNTQMKFGLTD